MIRDEFVSDLDKHIESVEANIYEIRSHFNELIHYLKINELRGAAETVDCMFEHFYGVQDSVGKMMYHLLDTINDDICEEIK